MVQATRILQFYQNFHKFYTHQFSALLERTGLSMREIHVLLFLANNPAYTTARDVTDLRGISKSQVSQAVDLLAAEGFLRRTPDAGDRRVVHLAITAEGRPLAEECQAIQARCVTRLLTGLTAGETAQLRALLETVWENGVALAGEVE